MRTPIRLTLIVSILFIILMLLWFGSTRRLAVEARAQTTSQMEGFRQPVVPSPLPIPTPRGPTIPLPLPAPTQNFENPMRLLNPPASVMPTPYNQPGTQANPLTPNNSGAPLNPAAPVSR